MAEIARWVLGMALILSGLVFFFLNFIAEGLARANGASPDPNVKWQLLGYAAAVAVGTAVLVIP
jgi:hypothetical protein